MKIRKKSKQEQGITLIALVVTIIVLLILASVTISAVLGENGLVQKAKQAIQVHQNAVITENNQMNNAADFIDNLNGEDRWWIPTESELAEIQAAGAESFFIGTYIGSNVNITNGMTSNNEIKQINIEYLPDNPDIFYFYFIKKTGNNNELCFSYFTKNEVNSIIKLYEQNEATSDSLYLITKSVTQVPVWVNANTGSISYECPFGLDDITYYVSQSYFNRVMSHIRSAVANPVLFDDCYTITYNGNGGTPSKATDTKRAGSPLEMATSTRDGYIFDGWYTAAEGGTKVEYTTMPSKDETLYAHWRVPGSYTLTFVNELGQQQIPSITALEGSLIELPTPESNNDNAFFGRMVYKRRRRRKNFRKLYNNAFI